MKSALKASFSAFPRFDILVAGIIVIVSAALMRSPVKASETTDAMLAEYSPIAADSFSAESGQAIWVRDSEGRSCTSCHTDSVLQRGRHQRTGKVIEPMAPTVNPERLTDRKKINKWLLRNCKWTFQRECSAQEKGHILLWLSRQ